MSQFNESGSKYLREVPCMTGGKVDVYAVIDAFKVTCPARQHAVKKILCSGIRGKGDVLQDLKEARDAIDRAIQMVEQKNAATPPVPATHRESICHDCVSKSDCPKSPTYALCDKYIKETSNVTR